MRVLILGIDALEYDLIHEWNLHHLKQIEYGKVTVPITKGLGEPATEIVWPCFITGKGPKQMGFESPILYRQPYKWFSDHIYNQFTSSFTDIHPENILEEKKSRKRRILDNISSIMTKAGVFYHPMRKNIKASTLFDNPSLRTAHFHIPVYDTDPFPSYRKQIVDVIMKTLPPSEFLSSCKHSFQERWTELEMYLQQHNDWDVVMMYWFCLDAIQHAFFNKKLKIMDFYLLFNKYVGQFIQKLPSDILVLIISDHGQKNGIHTDYGFYSSNKKLHLKNPNITDFKDIIEKKIQKTGT